MEQENKTCLSQAEAIALRELDRNREKALLETWFATKPTYLGFENNSIDVNVLDLDWENYKDELQKEFNIVKNTKFKDVTPYKSNSRWTIQVPNTTIKFSIRCKKKKLKKYFKQFKKAFK